MIVGLTGRKQAGKNTAAKLLAVYSPLPVVEVSFAALLKQSAAAVLGVTVDDLERWKNEPNAVVTVGLAVEDGWVVEAKTQTVRQFLQRYGTEGHRDVLGDNFWVDAALPLDRDYSDKLYVVTDVRFPNEAERVKELGGVVVRVFGHPYVEAAIDEHPSERPLGMGWIDHKLLNERRDDNFAQLDREVRSLLKALEVSP